MMIHHVMGKEGTFQQYLESCERIRHLNRTHVFNYVRLIITSDLNSNIKAKFTDLTNR